MSAVAQTYLHAHGKCWFVSTINRESSALLAMDATYAETMAWEYEVETKQRGPLVAQEEAATDSLHGHNKVCMSLHQHGVYPPPENENAP